MDKLAPPRPPERLAAAEEALRQALAPMPGIRWAYLFGSAAGGGPFRDLDVALALEKDAYPGVALGGLIARIELATGLPVDAVDLKEAALELRAEVVYRGRVLVDREPDERSAWEVDTVRAWLDFGPTRRRYSELRLEALRAGSG